MKKKKRNYDMKYWVGRGWRICVSNFIRRWDRVSALWIHTLIHTHEHTHTVKKWKLTRQMYEKIMFSYSISLAFSHSFSAILTATWYKLRCTLFSINFFRNVDVHTPLLGMPSFLSLLKFLFAIVVAIFVYSLNFYHYIFFHHLVFIWLMCSSS